MRQIRLELLGGFSLKASDGTELSLPTRKDRQLLAYLAMQEGRSQSRERLASLLWADRSDPQARDSLRQSLASLRRCFRSVGLDPVTANRFSVQLNCTAVAIDALDFAEACVAHENSMTATDLYRGPFLDAFESATPEFEHWVEQERQRLENVAEHYVTAKSSARLSTQESQTVLELAQKLLANDTTLETVFRSVMRIHVARGERASALKAYSRCRDALRDELGVAPDQETEALYRDILVDQDTSPTSRVLPLPSVAAFRPVIAILPFVNLTGQDRLNFLCDGLAEDISTGLGRFRSMTVIDRFSAETVAASTSDTKEIGRQLGAGLLVQGSIKTAALRLRVTVRLVDAASRAQTWSDVFECDLSDVPGIPDQISTAIITTLENRVENAVVVESQNRPSMAAYECTLRGIKHLRGYAAGDNEKALQLFQQALRLEPGYALAQAYLAFAEIVIQNYDSAPLELLLEAKLRIDRALAKDPEDGRIRWLLATVHGYLREFDDEKRQLEQALSLNPNDANAKMNYGTFLTCFGEQEAGLAMIREAMLLNPFHPEWYWVQLGSAFLAIRRYEDAIEAFKRRTRPMVWVLTRLTICYAHLGRLAEMNEMAQRILEKDPDFRISQLRRGGWADEDVAHMKEGLRKAGLPE